MNASMKTMLNLSVLTFMLVAAPRQCSALIAIVDVSKAQAKEMGVTIRSQKTGDEGVMVCVEFKIQGVLKDFDRVELRIATEGKLGGKYLVSTPLLAKRRTEGSVSACFSADPSYLALSELWIVVPKPQGGTGYRLKVKEFVELEKSGARILDAVGGELLPEDSLSKDFWQNLDSKSKTVFLTAYRHGQGPVEDWSAKPGFRVLSADHLPTLVTKLDKFYQIPDNQHVFLRAAIQICFMEMSGKPQTEIDRALQQARKAFSRL